MTKAIIISLVVIGLVFLAWKVIQTKPNSELPQAVISDEKEGMTTDEVSKVMENNGSMMIDNDNISIEFKGFGPSKEHLGKIHKIDSNLSFDANGMPAGSLTVDMDSLATDNESVTKHLKTADFFDVAKYPTAKFTIKKITEGEVTGSFDIHGITKDITFPFAKNENSFKADFNIDMEEFGIKQTFANSVIEVILEVPFK